MTTRLSRTSKNKAGYSNPDHIGDVFQRGLTFRSWASFPGAITIDAAVGETSEELYSLPLGGLCRAVRCCSGLSRAGLNRTNRPIVCGAGRVMSGGFAFTSDLHVWSLFYAALVVDHAPRGFSFGATNPFVVAAQVRQSLDVTCLPESIVVGFVVMLSQDSPKKIKADAIPPYVLLSRDVIVEPMRNRKPASILGV